MTEDCHRRLKHDSNVRTVCVATAFAIAGLCCVLFTAHSRADKNSQSQLATKKERPAENKSTGKTSKQKNAVKTTVDFAGDIRPLLSALCFECHGSKTQESGLRLDRRTGLLQGGDSGEPAIAPGKSAASELFKRIISVDPDTKMPPEGKRLSPKQIALIKTWIDEGAQWSGKGDGPLKLTTDFWSFQPLGKITPPSLGSDWITNPIDAFILRKLKAAKLEPSGEAEAGTLIRRLYLDVLGLPPTPEEIDAFRNDTRPDAYQRLVERVLASPHYGQRWARHWLDVVRFAESAGFETNLERPDAYHYRDWVIESLNADKPYNQFAFEQIAGDTVGAGRATGFLVGGAYDRVKSPDISLTLMQRQDELSDMINTTGTTFLGLTLGCAKCHSHKFDPIPQKDYYAVEAVFAGVKHGSRPLRNANSDNRRRQADQLAVRIKEFEKELSQLGVRRAVNVKKNVEQFEPTEAKFVRLTIKATNSSQPCIDELEIYSAKQGKQPARNVALSQTGATASASSSLSGVPIHRLQHINDGKHGNSHSWISSESGKGWVQIELAKPTVIDRIVWGRDRTGKFQDRLAVDYVFEASLEPGQWRELSSSQTRIPYRYGTSQQVGPGFSRLTAGEVQSTKSLLAKLYVLRTRRKELTSGIPTIYAGVFEQPKPTHRLHRGDPMAPREIVVPNALSVIGTLELSNDTAEQDRRAALAKWISSPDNPLFARVIVNRIWHYHFGNGIVDTPSDLGKNGGRPTHPQLLDWLAGELIRSDWSLKQIHRLILNSTVYRQSAVPDTGKLAVDAGSRLLWRYPPRRLEAEVIRDSILSVSNVLRTKMQGPGFSLFEPNSNYVRVYTPKETFGPAEWRRMIYMTKIRMEHDSIFGAFDCPDAGQVAPKRSRSTTSIQALNLFNSEFTLAQSKSFAERLKHDAGSDRTKQINRAFRLTFGRQADRTEIEAASALVERHGLPALCRALFNANEFLFYP